MSERAEPAQPATIIHVAAGMLIATIVVAALYYGREVFMPVALAVLVGFVLDGFVSRLKRRGVPRGAAIAIVLVLSSASVCGIGYVLSAQVRSIATSLPQYQDTAQRKVQALSTRFNRPGVVDRFTGFVSSMRAVLEGGSRRRADGPMQVEVVERDRHVRQVREAAGYLLGPLSQGAIIALFVVMILIDRGQLRDRLLRLLGGDLPKTTDALNDAADRVRSYLTMQLAVNVSYGVPMALGLLVIGVPGALLWGIVAALMRFIPYVGAWVSALFPLLFAFAVDPSWGAFLWTLALIVALELVSNNVIEPWLYGNTTGLSAISIIFAASFWTALWGPVGLVLSTPLTVCLFVLGRHLPQLAFFDLLLGSQPALDEPTTLYHRLISDEADEAIELAIARVESSSVQSFYDAVGVPALALAHADRRSASTEHRARLASGTRAMLDELRELRPPVADGGEPLAALCLAGKGDIDHLAAMMASHALSLAGFSADTSDAPATGASIAKSVDLRGANTLCLSYFSPASESHARLYVRRLRRRCAHCRIVVALWNMPANASRDELARSIGADEVVFTIAELIRAVRAKEAVDHVGCGREVSGVVASAAGSPLAELRAQFEREARQTADLFGVSLAVVSVGGRDYGSGLRDTVLEPRESLLDARPERLAPSLARLATESRGIIAISDTALDPRFASDSMEIARGYRFAAGIALRTSSGEPLGALCVFDARPRELSEGEGRLLAAKAEEILRAMEADRALGHYSP